MCESRLAVLNFHVEPRVQGLILLGLGEPHLSCLCPSLGLAAARSSSSHRPTKDSNKTILNAFYFCRPPDHQVAVFCKTAHVMCGDLYTGAVFVKFSLYLSPELSIDVVGCESCNLPFLGN